MKRNGMMVIFYTIALIAIIQGAYGGIQVTTSGGGNGGSGSVSMNFDTLKTADVNSQIAINGATVTPSTVIKGPIATFEETHAVTDASGKSASVYVKVLNAPKGLTYASQVLPGEGNVDTQPQISAEQWLTVPKADSIKCTATASYGILSANVGLEEYKGTLKGDYVTLTGYYGKAVTTDALVLASQTAISGAANSIKIYGSATDSSGTYNVDTSLMGISGGKATFAGLSKTSSAGTTNQVEQNEHLHGTFTSTATYTPTIGTAQTKTMTSNYGTEYDLNMKAAQGSLPTGYLGYYVKRGTTASKIQGAVNAAQSGDTINIAAGKYAENVNINKVLTLKGTGNPTASSFALNAILGTGSGGITAPKIYVNPTAKIQDGVNLASSKGTVNVAAGTYFENVQIDKSVTVKGTEATQTIVDGYNAGSVFTIGMNNPKAVVSLASMTIQGGSGTIESREGKTYLVGGGIYNKGKLTLTGCTISKNIVGSSTSEGYGGGIYNGGYYSGSTWIPAILDVTSSTISENTAQYGGGIDNDGKTTIKTSVISGNIANSDTGFSGGGGIVNWNTMTVMDSTISGNTAALNGGGIANPGTLTVQRCTISSNTAQQVGGGIASSGTLTVTGGTISGNSANMGGGIASGGTLTVTGGTISENSANMGGGGIANFNGGTMTVTGSTISGNSAGTEDNKQSGGGISNSGTATITKSKIFGNKATWDGAGLHNWQGTMTVTDSSIYGNTAGENGGGTYNGGFSGYHGSMTLKNCVITGNNAGNLGGGTANFQDASTTTNGCTISGNTARNGGGLANWDGGTLTVQKSTISRNSAYDGGGFYNSGTATISSSEISGNTAERLGGGICNFGPATVLVSSNTISGNSATVAGGGIYNSGTATISRSTISGNSANDRGGGIYNWGTTKVSSSTISGNTARYNGGGIANVGNLYVDGTSQIVNNQATTGYGGGIWSSNSQITFDGTKFVVKSNKAHQPDTLPDGTPWYQQYGVYMESGTPTTKNGFNPAKQVTGNTYI